MRISSAVFRSLHVNVNPDISQKNCSTSQNLKKKIRLRGLVSDRCEPAETASSAVTTHITARILKELSTSASRNLDRYTSRMPRVR
jgi:hypothetical protein